MRLKIDWASLIVGSKCAVLALFYFVFEAKFSSTSPGGGGLYLEWRFNGAFFALAVLGGGVGWGRLYLEGLIHGRAYFRNFTVFLPLINFTHKVPDSQFK